MLFKKDEYIGIVETTRTTEELIPILAFWTLTFLRIYYSENVSHSNQPL